MTSGQIEKEAEKQFNELKENIKKLFIARRELKSMLEQEIYPKGYTKSDIEHLYKKSFELLNKILKKFFDFLIERGIKVDYKELVAELTQIKRIEPQALGNPAIPLVMILVLSGAGLLAWGISEVKDFLVKYSAIRSGLSAEQIKRITGNPIERILSDVKTIIISIVVLASIYFLRKIRT